MNAPDGVGRSWAALSQGEATGFEKGLFDPRVLTTVRYADPAAWVTATAIARALDPLKERVTAFKDRTGVIVTSDCGPIETMTAVAEATRQNFPSALRYPAANPGSLVGVSCIAFGFRGPTLCLLVSPSDGVPVGLLLAGRWLDRQTVSFAVLAACGRRSSGQYGARALLLGRPDADAKRSVVDMESAAPWLMSVPREGKP
jgi:hypothetical protein